MDRFQSLTVATALKPGSDVWVLCEHENSAWTSYIDWYLNYQLLKLDCHEPPHMPDKLTAIAKEFDFKLPKLNLAVQEPKLIPCRRHLPCDSVLLIPFKEPSQWFSQSLQTCQDLRKDTIRFFLPQGIDCQDFIAEMEAQDTLKIKTTVVPPRDGH